MRCLRYKKRKNLFGIRNHPKTKKFVRNVMRIVR